MTTRQILLQTAKELPADASIEDAMERLLFMAKVQRGIEQADAGQTISHESVKARMRKWLK